MGTPRLGAASLNISFSDAEGFKVEHGTDGTVLLHIAPENLEHEDWDRLWTGINNIQIEAYRRWAKKNPEKTVEDYKKTNPKNR
jgi:hypothetical protein